MDNKKFHFCLAILLFLVAFIVIVPAVAAQSQAVPVIAHQPGVKFTRGQALVLKVALAQKPDWLNVFWRAAGADDFNAQTFKPGNTGEWETAIDTSRVESDRIEYYLACKAGGQIRFLPEKIPDELFSVVAGGPGPAMPVSQPLTPGPARQPFPLHVDVNVETGLNENSGDETAAFTHTENLRLNYRLQKKYFSLELQSRASYSNLLASGQTAFDLPDLRVSVRSRAHALRLGDIAPSESELTIGGMGRRGLEYVYDDQRFYVHLFTGGTQQLNGFKGLGIPRATASIFGGAAGFTFFRVLSLKAVYVSGEDDPALGGNIGTAPFYSHKRKGNVLAFVGQSRLWKDRLTLTAEYARSSFDPDTADAIAETPGTAFRIGGGLKLGSFDLRAGYRDVDADFNSIAQPFFINDRRGFDAAAGITVKTLRLSGALAFEKTNTGNDPAQVAARDFRRQLDISWQFRANSSLRLGYGASRQDARLNNNPVLQGNLNREGFSAGLSLELSPTLRIGADARSESLKSADNPLLEGSSLGMNVNASWQAANRFQLSLTGGISQTENTSSGEKAVLYNVFFNGDVTLIRQLLSLNGTAAYFRYDLAGPGDSISSNINGGICLHLKRILPFGAIVLSLRAGYISTALAGVTTTDSRLFLRADISL